MSDLPRRPIHCRQFTRKRSDGKWLRPFSHVQQKSVSEESWKGRRPPGFVQVNNECRILFIKTHGMMV